MAALSESPDTLAESDHRGPLLAVLLVALLLRIALPLVTWAVERDLGAFHEPDSGRYIKLVQTLMTSGEFALSPGDTPETLRTPGYPVFLAIATIGGSLEVTTIVLQVALGVATVALVFALAALVFEEPRTALVAAALYALEPLAILYCSKILSETLFTALLLSSLYAFARYTRSGSAGSLIAAALAIVGSIYVRANAVFIPVLVAPFVFYATPVPGRSRRWLASIAFLVICAGMLAPWIDRNQRRADFGGLSSVSDTILYFHQAASVTAAKNGGSFVEEQARLGGMDPELYFAAHPEQRAWTPGQIFRFQRSEGGRVVAENLGLYAWIHLKGVLRTLLNPGAAGFFELFDSGAAPPKAFEEVVDRGYLAVALQLVRDRPAMMIVNVFLAVYLLAVLSLAALGSIRAPWTNPLCLALGIVLLYLVAASGGPYSTSRYRQPIMPILSIFAASGLSARKLGFRCFLSEKSKPARTPA
jgi:4-amino-4-deoxy-L-arabinose transferase-like glycosyltransferase